MELARLIVEVLVAGAVPESSSQKDFIEIAKVVIGALGPIIAALIVGVAGVLITSRYAQKRETAEREAVNERARIEREAADNRHQKDLDALERRYSLDTEIETRSHAVELTKLEIGRKLEAWKADPNEKKRPLRPVIQDFLAVYRDLEELYTVSPKDLYEKIQKHRISRSKPPATVPEPELAQDVGSGEMKVGETRGTTPKSDNSLENAAEKGTPPEAPHVDD
jgi:hypothetical protein